MYVDLHHFPPNSLFRSTMTLHPLAADLPPVWTILLFMVNSVVLEVWWLNHPVLTILYDVQLQCNSKVLLVWTLSIMVLCWIHGSMEIGGVVVEPPVCLNSSTPRNVLLKRHAIFCGECTKNLCCQCHRNDGTHAFEAFFLQSYAGIWLRLFNVHLLHCTKYKIHSQGFTKYKFPSFRCFFEQKSKRIELTLLV